eukprot:4450946-Prymnesium_polylepis.1
MRRRRRTASRAARTSRALSCRRLACTAERRHCRPSRPCRRLPSAHACATRYARTVVRCIAGMGGVRSCAEAHPGASMRMQAHTGSSRLLPSGRPKA